MSVFSTRCLGRLETSKEEGFYIEKKTAVGSLIIS